MPTVSVVLPTYNRAALVCEAVDSVLAQGFSDLELIVVLDGETDDTFERLRSYDDPRMRLLRQANAGLSAARNRALEVAAGEFIALLDDDDVWLPAKLEMQVALLRQHPAAAFVYSEFHAWRPGHHQTPGGLRQWFDRGWYALDEWGAQTFHRGRPLSSVLPDRAGGWLQASVWHGNLYRALLAQPLILPSTALFRRDCVDPGVRFPEDDALCGDWSFFAELSRDHAAVFLDRETVLNRSHEDAHRLTRAPRAIRLEKRLAMTERVWGRDEAFRAAHDLAYARTRRRLLLDIARAHASSGDRARARRALRRVPALPGRRSHRDLVLRGALSIPGLLETLSAVRSMVRQRRS